MSIKHLTPYVWDQTWYKICNSIVYADLMSTAYNIHNRSNIKLSSSYFIDNVDDYSNDYQLIERARTVELYTIEDYPFVQYKRPTPVMSIMTRTDFLYCINE